MACGEVSTTVAAARGLSSHQRQDNRRQEEALHPPFQHDQLRRVPTRQQPRRRQLSDDVSATLYRMSTGGAQSEPEVAAVSVTSAHKRRQAALDMLLWGRCGAFDPETRHRTA